MTDEEKRTLLEIIGLEGAVSAPSRPRPEPDPDFMRKWEKWAQAQHQEFQRRLDDGNLPRD